MIKQKELCKLCNNWIPSFKNNPEHCNCYHLGNAFDYICNKCDNCDQYREKIKYVKDIELNKCYMAESPFYEKVLFKVKSEPEHSTNITYDGPDCFIRIYKGITISNQKFNTKLLMFVDDGYYLSPDQEVKEIPEETLDSILELFKTTMDKSLKIITE